MAYERERIFAQYGDGTGEHLREGLSRSNSMEFRYTKKILSPYINKNTTVLEIGCAGGYYARHFAPLCREYTGVDFFAPHIEVFGRTMAQSGITNARAEVGDATDLAGFADGSFEAVLCLGPMYHLPPELRERAFAESARVCRSGGVLAFAYINKIGVYAGACAHDRYRSVYPNEKTNRAVFTHGTDDERPELFYFTSPEEMEAVAARHGLRKLHNLGTEFMLMACAIDQMDDAKFADYTELSDAMSASESCTGMSNHALLVAAKT